LKISKNTQLLGGAVLLGVLCFFGAQYYLRSTLSDAQAKLAGAYKTRKVIVASVEIPAGSVLSNENLALRTIPERYLASTALDPESLDTVIGQKLVVSVKPGDPIDRGALERGDKASLSTTVGKGERAITFPVDEISSISGMLVPGDMIDLLFTGPGNTANSYSAAGTSPADTGPKELLHVRPILQSVQVMATGKTTQKRVIRTQTGDSQEVNMDFTTVTLKVNPAQAEQVLLGQKLGSLTAVLRNPDDAAPLGKMVLDEASFKQVEPRPTSGVVAGKYIEMIVGGMGTAGAMHSQMAEGKDAPLAVRLEGMPPAPQDKPQPSALDVKNRLGLTPPSPQRKSDFSNPTTR